MSDEPPAKHFIQQFIDEDIAAGKCPDGVVTRFPPEPNGFLHIGHAKAICLSFGLAKEYGGRCHLRFDDTNPAKEEQLFIDSIKEDIRWLGFDWGEHEYYASGYFEQLWEWACQLIRDGLAYVEQEDVETMRQKRGSLTEPGIPSEYRDRPAEESLALFEEMRAGKHEEGSCVLRAKIDLASPNMNLRDPVLYRILKMEHPKTGDTWCLYPNYDFAHGQSDSIEGITHSLCTLEFENHRPLYDWFCEALKIYHPRQIEFAKLQLSYTIVSKRNLRLLVEKEIVSGWDDPRMPTLSGLRRRGVTPASIRNLCEKVGITKFDSTTDLALFEHCLRDDLNKVAPRFMAVLDPLKVVITNYEQAAEDLLEAINNPEDEAAGTRQIAFGPELWIERADFLEDAPKKFFRLAPGREVRLRYAYFITCQEVIKDETGKVVELRCTYDPETRGGNAPDGRKVKGTIHWVNAATAVAAEVRLYDRLFTVENPGRPEEGKSFIDYLNEDSLQVVEGQLEPALANQPAGFSCQFERTGYFCVDADSTEDKPVWNRTITLKDSWAKKQ